jgi:hypothetical protein
MLTLIVVETQKLRFRMVSMVHMYCHRFREVHKWQMHKKQ